MPGWVGPWELLILVGVLLLIFGPKRLPEVGRSLGRSVREIKDSIGGSEVKEAILGKDEGGDDVVDGSAKEVEDDDWLSLPKPSTLINPKARMRRAVRRRLL